MRILVSSFALIAACSTPVSSPMHATPPPPILEISPLIPGLDGTVTIEGVGPYEQVHLARAFALGNGTCVRAAGGLCLDITQGLTYLGTIDADANGVAHYDFVVPPSAPVGAEVAFQAIVVRGLRGASSLKTDAVLTTLLADDVDGDGFNASEDCDDANPMVYPGAEERCDGLDNDCDGAIEPDGAVLLDGRYPYPTLDAAIGVAASGGFIELCAGTIPASTVIIDRPMTIRGQGPGVTTVTGAYLEVRASGVTIEGMTLTQASGPQKFAVSFEDGTSDNTLRHAEITGDSAVRIDGSISWTNATASIIDTHFHDNTVDSALWIGGYATLEDVTLTDNHIELDGAALALWTGDVTATRLTVHGTVSDHAYGKGGMMINQPSTFECTDCNFGIGTTDNAPHDIYLPTTAGFSGPTSYAYFHDGVDISCETAWTTHRDLYGDCELL